tara:strand:+ start:239 stop:742 length:504 start_codon:yes stop_codon:yes gene_type:complete
MACRGSGVQIPLAPLIDTSPSSNTLKEIETINKIDIDSITYQSLSDIEALNYLATHDDLGKLFGNDIEATNSHYENHGKYEGRILDDFDEWGYLASNNDLMNVFENNTIEGIKHHISFGITEGRSTNIFDAESYLNNNADLRNNFGDNKKLATKHYLEYDFNEGGLF